jgi:hypothetical protein
MHYAACRKVAGLNTAEVIEFLSIYLILPAVLGPEVYSTSNKKNSTRGTNKKCLESKARPALKAGNVILAFPLFRQRYQNRSVTSLHFVRTSSTVHQVGLVFVW